MPAALFSGCLGIAGTHTGPRPDRYLPANDSNGQF